MTDNLVFAFRNLWRSRMRTFLQWFGITVTTLCVVIWTSILGGFTSYLHYNANRLTLGVAQIHHADFLRDEDPYKLVASEELLSDLDGLGFFVSPRLMGDGLAIASDKHTGIRVFGIDPDKEFQVTSLKNHIAEGGWFRASTDQGVVIGRGVAERLDLSVDDKVTLVGTSALGGYASGHFIVKGILKPVSLLLDQKAMYMNLEEYRNFFDRQVGAHELALRERQDVDKEKALRSLMALKPSLPDLRMRLWQDIRPNLARIIAVIDLNIWVMFVLVYMALGCIIVNLKLMDIHDRLREFGTMKALGMPPFDIVKLVLTESLLLAFLASISTLPLGYALVSYLHSDGVDLSRWIQEMSMAGVSFSPVVFGRMSVYELFVPEIFVLVMLPLASLYPAIKASRFSPLEAMRR